MYTNLIERDNQKYKEAAVLENSFPPRSIFMRGHHRGLAAGMLDGMILEFGVHSGATIQAIQSIYQAPVYGFDSWQGLPEDDGYFKKGEFDLKGVKPRIENSQITLIDGWFEDTLPGFVSEHKDHIRFINFDADIYSSTKTIFKYLKDRFVKGTVMYFDEYKMYSGWETREYKAFLEFIDETGFDYEYICRSDNDERCCIILL